MLDDTDISLRVARDSEGFIAAQEVDLDSTGPDLKFSEIVPAAPMGGKIGRKRDSSGTKDADDILEQICSKLTNLSTKDSQSNRDGLISAFMSVLECSHDEAVFFLESSTWNIEIAVHHWLDSGNIKRQKQIEISFSQRNAVPIVYERRQVFVDGMDPDWTAWISRSKGTVYFLHGPTGTTQASFPIGKPDHFSSSSSSLASGDSAMKEEGVASSAGYNTELSDASAPNDDDLTAAFAFDGGMAKGLGQLGSALTGSESGASSQEDFTATSCMDGGNVASMEGGQEKTSL